MKQGRKSKTALLTVCALALLTALLAYGAIAPAVSMAQDDSAAGQEYGGAGIPGSGGNGPQPGDQEVSGSDDGGAPVLLIALAVIAAGCTGLAIWRLRKPHDGPPDAGSSSDEGGSVTGESRPL